MPEGVPALVDDRASGTRRAATGTDWELVTDRVMGGVSSGRLAPEEVLGRPALRLTGDVSLENNGGFVQMALDLAPGAGPVDASGFSGLAFEVTGNGEEYGVHLRTADVARPWQSYRATFIASPDWRRVELPFAGFEPHRIEAPFDRARLRRIGLVAIGRKFHADLALGRLEFVA
jgi:hypothetical protein